MVVALKGKLSKNAWQGRELHNVFCDQEKSIREKLKVGSFSKEDKMYVL